MAWYPMTTAMTSATAGSSQYQPPVARMIPPVATTPAAASASSSSALSTRAATVMVSAADGQQRHGYPRGVQELSGRTTIKRCVRDTGEVPQELAILTRRREFGQPPTTGG